MGGLTAPDILAGVPLGEGETRGMVILVGLADQLIGDSDLDYADLIDKALDFFVCGAEEFNWRNSQNEPSTEKKINN